MGARMRVVGWVTPPAADLTDLNGELLTDDEGVFALSVDSERLSGWMQLRARTEHDAELEATGLLEKLAKIVAA